MVKKNKMLKKLRKTYADGYNAAKVLKMHGQRAYKGTKAFHKEVVKPVQKEMGSHPSTRPYFKKKKRKKKR